MSLFFSVSPIGTVLACLLKTTIAGIVAGLIMPLFKKNTVLGSIVASATVPILNTGIFALFAIIFFKQNLEGLVVLNPELYPNVGVALLVGFIGFNFIIEIISTVILAPSIYKILLRNASINQKDL